MPTKSKSRAKGRPISAAQSFWREVNKRGGLNRVRRNGDAGFDGGFETAVRGALGLPTNQPIPSGLKTAAIKLEALVAAVLTAAAPWSAMMRDVLETLEEAGSSHPGDAVALVLKKSRVDPKLALTLDAFRRQSAEVERILMLSPDRRWGDVSWSDLRLPELLSLPLTPRRLDPPIARWAGAFRAQHQSQSDAPFSAPPPPVATGVEAYDEARRMAHAWLTSALSVTGSIGRTLVDRREALRSQDGAAIFGWSSDDLVVLDSDYVGHDLLMRLEEAPAHYDRDALDRIGLRLGAILSAASAGEPVESVRNKLLDIFDLPLWKHRHDLFSIWIGTRIARLTDGPLDWILKDGALDFSFKASTLARFKPASPFVGQGEMALWSELKQKIDKPVGKHRKGHVQPDYSVVAHARDRLPVGLVVEVKQYWKPSAGNFRAALIDYARAHPLASVLLANYGLTPSSIAADLGLDGDDQVVQAFGEVRPLGAGLKGFEAAVREGLQSTARLANEAGVGKPLIVTARTQDAAATKGAKRRQVFHDHRAEAVVRLSWATGGDLDLRAVPLQSDSPWSPVMFDNMGHLDWPPYVALDRDDQTAPGRETITLARLDRDWRIEVHRYSGDWPIEPVRVEVEQEDKTVVHERDLAGSDLCVWEVCTVQLPQTLSTFDEALDH